MSFLSAPADARIDIVYLWVDGNDPTWRARRHQAARQHGAIDVNTVRMVNAYAKLGLR
ncbi:MAG: Stealth CR1 domain-containing protein, partial [Hydrogenophaga sp.]|nr:Stealth CR1 domain-containing protein [Hydrogenophaga sp.]